MNEEIQSPNPDQLEVNKVVRVLAAKPQKYTVHLLMKDGTERQLQTEFPPKVKWSDETRNCLVVVGLKDEYSTIPICAFDDVSVIQVEENPS